MTSRILTIIFRSIDVGTWPLDARRQQRAKDNAESVSTGLALRASSKPNDANVVVRTEYFK